MELLIPIILWLYLYFTSSRTDVPVWTGGDVKHVEDAFISRYRRIMERGDIR